MYETLLFVYRRLRFQKGRNGECGLENAIRDLRRALIAEVELFN